MTIKGLRGVELSSGETFTLFASAARTASAGTNGTAVYLGGERRRFIILLDTTVCDTEGTDTCDVYVDWSFDDSTYYNAGHFTQRVGTDSATKEFMILDSTTPGTAVIDVTSDATSGVVRPQVFGAYIRARYVIVDGGGTAASFTFSVTGWAE